MITCGIFPGSKPSSATFFRMSSAPNPRPVSMSPKALPPSDQVAVAAERMAECELFAAYKANPITGLH